MEKLQDGTPLNVAVYKAYRNAGLSHSQALAITAEVGRENGFQSKYLFGTHTDPAANTKGGAIKNVGMLSWNQGRGNALASFLSKNGLLGNNGIQRSQAALNAQARFSVAEMKSPKYASKLKTFWSNPNANPEAFSRELGKHYVVWAYGQDTIRAKGGGRTAFDWKKHDNRRRNHLQSLANMTGGGYESEPQRPGTVSVDQLRAVQRPNTIRVSDLEQRVARPEAIPVDKLRQPQQSSVIASSSEPEPAQPEPQPSGKLQAITAELPKLKEQGLNPYQALYALAQRDDDVGTSIRGAFNDGMNTEQMANYFGVNDIWQSQNEPSSSTLQIDEQREYQTPSLLQS